MAITNRIAVWGSGLNPGARGSAAPALQPGAYNRDRLLGASSRHWPTPNPLRGGQFRSSSFAGAPVASVSMAPAPPPDVYNIGRLQGRNRRSAPVGQPRSAATRAAIMADTSASDAEPGSKKATPSSRGAFSIEEIVAGLKAAIEGAETDEEKDALNEQLAVVKPFLLLSKKRPLSEEEQSVVDEIGRALLAQAEDAARGEVQAEAAHRGAYQAEQAALAAASAGASKVGERAAAIAAQNAERAAEIADEFAADNARVNARVAGVTQFLRSTKAAADARGQALVDRAARADRAAQEIERVAVKALKEANHIDAKVAEIENKRLGASSRHRELEAEWNALLAERRKHGPSEATEEKAAALEAASGRELSAIAAADVKGARLAKHRDAKLGEVAKAQKIIAGYAAEVKDAETELEGLNRAIIGVTARGADELNRAEKERRGLEIRAAAEKRALRVESAGAADAARLAAAGIPAPAVKSSRERVVPPRAATARAKRLGEFDEAIAPIQEAIGELVAAKAAAGKKWAAESGPAEAGPAEVVGPFSRESLIATKGTKTRPYTEKELHAFVTRLAISSGSKPPAPSRRMASLEADVDKAHAWDELADELNAAVHAAPAKKPRRRAAA